MKFSFKYQLALLLLLLAKVQSAVSPFDGSVALRIFSHHQKLLLYIRGITSHPRSENTLYQLCQTSECAILDPNDHQYNHITNFIGFKSYPYFAIIDSQEQMKYLLPIKVNFEQQQLVQFISDFNKNVLQPFYASEEAYEEDRQKVCQRLVGSTYEDFLTLEDPLKIVYLYSSDSNCEACPELLNKFNLLAVKHDEKELMVFGYIDVTNNDNRFIKDQIYPYFLIYVLDNFEDPYGLSAEEFNELDESIVKMKKDFIRKRQVREGDALSEL